MTNIILIVISSYLLSAGINLNTSLCVLKKIYDEGYKMKDSSKIHTNESSYAFYLMLIPIVNVIFALVMKIKGKMELNEVISNLKTTDHLEYLTKFEKLIYDKKPGIIQCLLLKDIINKIKEQSTKIELDEQNSYVLYCKLDGQIEIVEKTSNLNIYSDSKLREIIQNKNNQEKKNILKTDKTEKENYEEDVHDKSIQFDNDDLYNVSDEDKIIMLKSLLIKIMELEYKLPDEIKKQIQNMNDIDEISEQFYTYTTLKLDEYNKTLSNSKYLLNNVFIVEKIAKMEKIGNSFYFIENSLKNKEEENQRKRRY